MAHQDGRCATDAETIYLENRPLTCVPTSPGGGTTSTPYCNLGAALGDVDASHRVLAVRGAVAGSPGTIQASNGVSSEVSIVGVGSASGGTIYQAATMTPIVSIDGAAVYLRNINLSASDDIGIVARNGATLRLDRVLVDDNKNGGLLVDGAAFDIRNSTFTNNGPGDATGTAWGGVRIQGAATFMPRVLTNDSITVNKQIGLSCTAAVVGTGVLVGLNAGGVDVSPTCGDHVLCRAWARLRCAMTATDLTVQQDFRRFGPYVLLRCSGAGGFGRIDLALKGSPQLAKVCVVKRMQTDERSPELAARFRREAEIALQLAHGAIAQTVGVEEIEGELCLLQEFVDGVNLRHLEAQCKPELVPLPVALHIVREVGRALAYAHGLGIVHRDVTPENIMLSYGGEVKLIDFGIARRSGDATLTQAGVVVGRETYTAPEVWAGNKADPRSDVFSLGVVLWQLVTGEDFQRAQEKDISRRTRSSGVERRAQLRARRRGSAGGGDRTERAVPIGPRARRDTRPIRAEWIRR